MGWIQTFGLLGEDVMENSEHGILKKEREEKIFSWPVTLFTEGLLCFMVEGFPVLFLSRGVLLCVFCSLLSLYRGDFQIPIGFTYLLYLEFPT